MKPKALLFGYALYGRINGAYIVDEHLDDLVVDVTGGVHKKLTDRHKREQTQTRVNVWYGIVSVRARARLCPYVVLASAQRRVQRRKRFGMVWG
jgi:hypothetical protein